MLINRRAGWLFVFLWATIASADTVTLSATSDTFLVSSSPDNNAGSHTHVAAGTSGAGSSRRGLFQFDLTTLPAGATITSATFQLEVVGDPATGDADSDFELLTLTDPWGEGAQSGNAGSPAVAGEATWNSRFHGATAWATAGGDFLTPSLATQFITGVAVYEWTSPALLAQVQTWQAAPAANAGLLLRSLSEGTSRTARRFGSSEGGSPAQLVIAYDLPPPPAPLATSALTRIELTATNLLLAWTNAPDQTYDVLFTDDLPGGAWQVAAANLPATNSATQVWTDPPYLAGPLFPSNRTMHYAVAGRAATSVPVTVKLQLIASGLTSPVAAAHAGDGSDRIFICEQRGQILIVDSNRTLLPQPFLDLTASVTNLSPGYDERGLLGLAFHPDYEANGRFYVYYSTPTSGPGVNHASRLSSFQVTLTNANLADPTSEQVLLQFNQPESNHNGGSLAFGPDGFLYISTGDGGGAGDNHPPYGNAQNISNLLGKILRIDVDGAPPYAIPPDNPLVGVPGARAEIFAWGLRNPWKTAFDGTNCWVADVGQNLWEEINLLRKGGNYGWKILEGHHAFDVTVAATTGINPQMLDHPIHEYRHGPLGISIIGGAIYRGTNLPALVGHYVFGDFSTSFGVPDGRLYYLAETRAGLWERFAFQLAPTGGPLGRYVKAFAQDEQGELYLLSTTNLGPTGTSGDIRMLAAP